MNGLHYESVIAALRDGHGFAANIATYTGLHVSTVRKRLNAYEAEGVAFRWPGNGTAQCADYWVLSEHPGADAAHDKPARADQENPAPTLRGSEA